MTTNAPKRIWANCTTPLATRKSGTWTEDPYGQLFIRADLSPSPEVVKELVEALRWYGEQARLARLIHSEGDAGRHAISNDGGKRALAVLAKLEGGE